MYETAKRMWRLAGLENIEILFLAKREYQSKVHNL